MSFNSRILSFTIALTLGAGMLAPSPAQAQWVVSDPGHTFQTIINALREKQESIQAHTMRLKKYQQMIKDYHEMVRQGLALGDEVFDTIQSPIADLVELYHDSKHLLRSIGDIDKEFRQRYKGYGDYLKEALGGANPYTMSNRHARFSRGGPRPDKSGQMTMKRKEGAKNQEEVTQVEQWHEEAQGHIVRALEAASIPTSAFDDDKAMLAKLVKRSSKAKGRMQAIQAGNEIAAMLVQQMQRMNVLVAEQLKFQTELTAQKNERMIMTAAQRKAIQGDPPKDTSSIGFR